MTDAEFDLRSSQIFLSSTFWPKKVMGAWLTTCDARLRSASCASVDALRGRRACFSICHRRARPPSAPRCHVSRPTCIWGTHDFGCLAVSAADCFCRFPVVRCRFQSVSCRPLSFSVVFAVFSVVFLSSAVVFSQCPVVFSQCPLVFSQVSG